MTSGKQKTVKLPMRKANLIALDTEAGKLVIVRPTENGHDYIEVLNISNNNHSLPCQIISPENGSIQNVIIVDNGEFVIVFSNGSVGFCDEKHYNSMKIIQNPGSEIVASYVHDTSTSTICLITGTTLNIFDLHSNNVLSSIIVASKCATSPIVSDGYKIAIGLAGDIILVEEMKTKVNLKLSPRCECEENAPRSLLFMDSKILVCGDSYGTVTFWNLDDFTLIQSLPCLLSSILSMVTTADGLLYVCGEDP
ncbi:hypothetical protein GCK72_005403 [Caenorhabditis remanei]|uniref:Uncharacterized protein n=1 Tax=Caenorhabditis remanei TaxID=31234 RepID=A0A6A5HCF7_CAERE|nr:hypothetical protein GCK72_005400 [Caenorhabditis remanei]XP_053589361.1 hypothetical protein GCK72_005403 [Caenorhabditis remanei]KAF1765448.1 hypothetical protein GCK72_005400 [Caenorhabditis remanei]KAF1765451.1 hypothetical protein GCK72_005403 [Caenorhabditis remanei]